MYKRKKNEIYQRTNRVSGVGMATSFERGVCRLIDAGSKPINWSNSHPPLMDGVDAFRFPPPCVWGCACHQTAWPCLKFRTVHPWNIDIPCWISQGQYQRTLSSPLARVVTEERARVYACVILPVYRKLRIPNFVEIRGEEISSNPSACNNF